MKRILFVLLMMICSVSFGIELNCSGTGDWRIINSNGYKGKTHGLRDMVVEISLEKTNSGLSVSRIFSGYLPYLSLCFINQKSKSRENNCRCTTTENEIFCSYAEQAELPHKNMSSITLNRKTAIAEVIQSMDIRSNDISYTTTDYAKLHCQVFEKNQF